MMVRLGERDNWIEQARFLQSKEDGIGAQLSAKAAVAQFVIRLSGVFLAIGIADLRFLAAAAFEHTKDIPGLRSFPPEKRVELGNHAFGAHFSQLALR